MSVIKRIHTAETMFADSYTKNERYKSKFYSFKKSFSPISEHFSTTMIDGLEIRPPSFFYGPTTAPTAAQERTLKNITKATRKMSSYIFLQMIQYTPIIIYSLCILMNQMQTWVYVLTVVMLNLGGVAKSFVFMKSNNNTNGEEKKKRGNSYKYKTSSNDNNEICFYDDKQKDVPIITVIVNQKDFL